MRRLMACGGLLFALLVTVGAGLLHGRVLHRWGPTEFLRNSSQRLEQFPEQFGSWTLVKRDTLAPEAERMLQCSGYLLRTYLNQETGETVTVSVIQGPAGPISVHTPEICYSSRNFRVLDQRQVAEIGDRDDRPDQLWALTMQSTDVDESLLRVYYGWSVAGAWEAPKSSRFAYAGQPYLYKIQLASLPRNLSEHDPCLRFLEEFLPELRRQVFSSPAG